MVLIVIYCEFVLLQYMFNLQQVKRDVISNIIGFVYELPYEFLNHLRLRLRTLKNQETLAKNKNFLRKPLSTQSPYRNDFSKTTEKQILKFLGLFSLFIDFFIFPIYFFGSCLYEKLLFRRFFSRIKCKSKPKKLRNSSDSTVFFKHPFGVCFRSSIVIRKLLTLLDKDFFVRFFCFAAK